MIMRSYTVCAEPIGQIDSAFSAGIRVYIGWIRLSVQRVMLPIERSAQIWQRELMRVRRKNMQKSVDNMQFWVYTSIMLLRNTECAVRTASGGAA